MDYNRINREYNHQTIKDKYLPIITIILTVTNIVMFIVYTMVGDLLYNIGSLSMMKVVGDGEYYRLISCMFLHGGIEHLCSNMLILYFLGEMLEKEIGHLRYVVLYFIAGVGSGVFSMAYEYLTGTVIFSIGASGAIYGIIGAMLFLVILYKGRYGQITLRRMIFAIVYMLYSGMRSVNVNNAAHIGGLLCGFLVAVVMHLGRGSKRPQQSGQY